MRKNYGALVNFFKKFRAKPLRDTLPVPWQFYLVALLMTFFSLAGFDKVTFDLMQRRLEFHVKHLLGQDISLNSKIKIISFEDKTLSKLKRPEMNDLEWSALISAITARSPRAIIVDKIFSTGFADNAAYEQLAAAQRPDVRWIVGSAVANGKIEDRTPVSFEQYKDFAPNPNDPHRAEPSWLPVEPGFHYGPAERIQKYFRVGHFLYDGDGHVRPFLRPEENRIIPHVSFLIENEIKLGKNSFTIGSEENKLPGSHRLSVNFLPANAYLKQNYSLFSVLNAVQKAKPISFVQPGDIVFILPLMYTGNVDFKATPVGDLPGGYILVSLVQSVLSGHWIREPIAGVTFVLLCFGVSFLLALVKSSRRMIVFGTLIVVLFPVLGLFAFSKLGISFPWMMGSVYFILCLSALIMGRLRAAEKKAEKIESAFSGLVSSSVLKEMINRPESDLLAPREVSVTVMFIDVVGFSLIAESASAKEVFSLLQGLLDEITKIVHKYEGTVDRTLGDGALCYFGYRLGTVNVDLNHADLALKCAEEIQKFSAKDCIQALEAGKQVLPLRVGLNSGSVFLGNVGNSRRIDVTLIGNCVNYAKRLEDSCEAFRIMIGAGTYEMLSVDLKSRPEVQQRLVSIKHHSNLWDAFEIHPFANNMALYDEALAAYRKFLGTRIKETRWEVPVGLEIAIFIDGVHLGKLLDFSLSGFSVYLKNYLAQKVKISLEIGLPGSQVRAQLVDAGLVPLFCEVRWGQPSLPGYTHGLYISNLLPEAREKLASILAAHVGVASNEPVISNVAI